MNAYFVNLKLLEAFEQFKTGWEQTSLNLGNNNPHLSMFIGEFNGRNTIWWGGDISNSVVIQYIYF